MMTVVIGLDLGTTAAKAIALTPAGKVLAQTSTDYPLRTPAPGQVVQDPEDLWQGVVAVLRTLAEQVSLTGAAGLCFSGAMHNLLPVTTGGEPLAPALTWADNRAAPQARALRREVDERALYRRTGCPLQAVYHPARLRWWQEQGVPAGTAYFVGLKDWILHRLTGVWGVDTALASTTGLLDINRRQWDEEALALAGVSRHRLPPLVAPTAVVGTLTMTAAAATGLSSGLPVIAGNHDGGLANVGAGAEAVGELVITVGTSGAVRIVVDTPCLDPEMRTWCYVLEEDLWLAGGAINNGGLALQWIREQCFQDLSGDWQARTEAVLAEVAQIPAGAEGVLALPYLTGERTPHWDADGRATIHGLKLGHSRAHMARAVLEGVAFCLADVWQAVEGGLKTPFDRSRPAHLTGGITHSLLWSQIVSDVLGIPLLPEQRADASTLGAALLGQYALGLIDTFRLQDPEEEPPSQWLQPDSARHALYTVRYQQFRELYRQLHSDA